MRKLDYVLAAALAIAPAAAKDWDAQVCDRGVGILLTYYLSALAAGQTVQLTLLAVAADGSTFEFAQTVAMAAAGDKVVIAVYPGATAAGKIGNTTFASLSAPLPYRWFLRETFGDNTGLKALTRSISYVEIP